VRVFGKGHALAHYLALFMSYLSPPTDVTLFSHSGERKPRDCIDEYVQFYIWEKEKWDNQHMNNRE